MNQITTDKTLIAYCGIYCGACPKFLKEKCPGCQKNEKATWCKVRTCCIENNYTSCADCKDFENVADCKKFNNFFSKLIGFILRSDRKACIELIKEKGYDDFAKYMAENKLITIRK